MDAIRTSIAAAGAAAMPGDEPERVLVTGASGFIGTRVVEALLAHGARRIRCMVRSEAAAAPLLTLRAAHDDAEIDVAIGNLLSRADCVRIAGDASVVIHLAAGRGEKEMAQAYLDTVVTTRNLLDVLACNDRLRRLVHVSSLSVYGTGAIKRGAILDESCAIDARPELRGDAYTFAKVEQERVVADYATRYRLPCVVIRPGVVFGPGNPGIHGRVGLSTFGIFLHLGGRNALPLTFVENCADAIVLAALRPGVEGQVFNVVDDAVPTSRQFLAQYKRRVHRFASIRVPYPVWYAFCYAWEGYVRWSQGQLPDAFNRPKCAAYWRAQRYSNDKLKRLLGWRPAVPMRDALERYFAAERANAVHEC
jgi:nucleoside-diphosphate-sugar epimerase